MGEGAVGLYYPPEGNQAGEYIRMGDGKYYHKSVAHEKGIELAAKAMRDDMTREEHYIALSEEPNSVSGIIHPDGRVETGVGDVNSDRKGSGARYNAGKPPMAYIPFRQQFIVLRGYDGFCQRPDLMQLVEDLDKFERREIRAEDIIERLEITDLHDATYVWDYGAKKYAAFNWAKGMAWSIPLACISRHLQAIVIEGEEFDSESGCKHWGHIVCNLLMLEHFEKFYREGDDRPPVTVF